ncbi:hypothetical protein IMSHALPRED_010391 [Imshaugia aleurites]|uniref:Uncharacterized protein n=1 Tax=Imshaugia aleurites TaxID=172621 RepID=A0A8H3IPV3_9LECA|nr:hypothetical protein IMSHALPRED_010391 [Imshaugia aleurites]
MFGSDSISTHPGIAKQQIWERLPGKYELTRDKHHNMLLNDQTYTSADLTQPSYGFSEIRSRAPTDPAYQSELLQACVFYLEVTQTRDVFRQTEARVFRRRDGEWSLWSADGSGVATEKITDLALGREMYAGCAQLRAVPQPWRDENVENIYLGMEFHAGEGPYWTLYHRIKKGEGEVTVQGTTYRKIPEDRQEGWLGWLAEGAKVGFVGMKGYLGV